MQNAPTLEISSSVDDYPALPYNLIKDAILGKKYQLSLVFVGEAKARTINQQTRKKDYVPNVLSFPFSKDVGEIFITPKVAKKEAKLFHRSYEKHLGFLFIHGLLHLKGMDHGQEMEDLERKYQKKFKLD